MTMRTTALGLAALLLGLAAPASAQAPASWPGWRGPQRDAQSPDKGLLASWPATGPKLLFKATGLGTGFSSLAIAAGRVYTMGDVDGTQHVIALDATDGKKLWATAVGPAWVDEFPGPRATPTVDGNLVFAVGTEGDAVALDAASGKEVWRKSLSKDFGGVMMSIWKFSESPLVDGDRLILTPGGPDALMVALDKKTGKEIWRTAAPDLGSAGRPGAGYAGAVISNGAGVKQYVQLVGRGLVGVRASDGKLLWHYGRVANQVANISTPVVKGDYVFASTGYQTGSALLKLVKSATGVDAQEVYFLEAPTFQNHHGGFVVVGDTIYAGHGHNRGHPIALDFATGKVLWGGPSLRNAGSGSAAVHYADGHLYFRYQNGKMVLIEATPAGYKEKGSFDIPGVEKPSWSHPVVLGGRLYLREQDALYVYDVKAS
jgi:outer membrane protein assembly factor BamB